MENVWALASVWGGTGAHRDAGRHLVQDLDDAERDRCWESCAGDRWRFLCALRAVLRSTTVCSKSKKNSGNSAKYADRSLYPHWKG
jgi:hypothetical protein